MTIPISTPLRDFMLMGWPTIYNWRKFFKEIDNTFTFVMWICDEIIHWIDIYWASIITSKVLGSEHTRIKPECLQTFEGERQVNCVV